MGDATEDEIRFFVQAPADRQVERRHETFVSIQPLAQIALETKGPVQGFEKRADLDGGVDIRVGDGNFRVQTPWDVGQDPRRRQIRGFTMDGPGGITYVWQVQYGVRVNVDDPTRSSLPELFTGIGDGNRISEFSEDGVFWFDPGTELTVATEKTERQGDRNDLNGWVNGDSYYFSGTASIDATGAFGPGEGSGTNADGTPTSTWNNGGDGNGFDEGGTSYLGLEIPSLQRPVRVMWRYGNAAFAVNVTVTGLSITAVGRDVMRAVSRPEG